MFDCLMFGEFVIDVAFSCSMVFSVSGLVLVWVRLCY